MSNNKIYFIDSFLRLLLLTQPKTPEIPQNCAHSFCCFVDSFCLNLQTNSEIACIDLLLKPRRKKTVKNRNHFEWIKIVSANVCRYYVWISFDSNWSVELRLRFISERFFFFSLFSNAIIRGIFGIYCYRFVWHFDSL